MSNTYWARKVLAVLLYLLLTLSLPASADDVSTDRSAVAKFLSIGFSNAPSSFLQIRGAKIRGTKRSSTEFVALQRPDTGHFKECKVTYVAGDRARGTIEQYVYSCRSTHRHVSAQELLDMAVSAVSGTLPGNYSTDGPHIPSNGNTYQVWKQPGHPNVEVSLLTDFGDPTFLLAMTSLPLNEKERAASRQHPVLSSAAIAPCPPMARWLSSTTETVSGDESAIAQFLSIAFANVQSSFSATRGESDGSNALGAWTEYATVQWPDHTHFRKCRVTHYLAKSDDPEQWDYACYSTTRRVPSVALFKMASSSMRANLSGAFYSSHFRGISNLCDRYEEFFRPGPPDPVHPDVAVYLYLENGRPYYELVMWTVPLSGYPTPIPR